MADNLPSDWKLTGVQQRFEELFNAGDSHSIIAAKLNHEFGTNFTRAACIGRAYRLGLTGRVPTYVNPATRLSGYTDSTPLPHTPRPQPVEAPAPVVGLGITLNELTNRTCKFPLPGEAITFCGLETDKGQSWCPYHRHVATRGKGSERAA